MFHAPESVSCGTPIQVSGTGTVAWWRWIGKKESGSTGGRRGEFSLRSTVQGWLKFVLCIHARRRGEKESRPVRISLPPQAVKGVTFSNSHGSL